MSDPTDASVWRADLASEIAQRYAAREPVRMVLLGGSTARGTADAFSDLDLVVVWEEVDGEWLDDAPLADWGARRVTDLPSDARGSRLEQYLFGTLKIDVANTAAVSLEAMLADVLERHESDGAKLKTLAVLQDSRALHGASSFAAWQARIAAYPPALCRAVVSAHLFFFPSWVPKELALDRGDWLGFHDYVGRAVRNVLAILAALNGVYFASDGEQKGTRDLVGRLRVAPERLGERIDAVLEQRSPAAIRDFYRLIEETLDQVDRALGDVDTKRARALLAWPLEATTRSPRA